MYVKVLYAVTVINFTVLLCSAHAALQLAVTAGGDITLYCTVTSVYPTWTGPELYNGYTQIYNNPGQSSFPNPNVPEQKRSRLDWGSDKSSLIIRDVILNDEGLYQCSSVAKINLIVREPPSSPVISNTETVDGTLIIRKSQSQETTLVCISSGGYPQPNVEWYRGNTGTQHLSSTSSVKNGTNTYTATKTYRFTPQRQDDGVKYICQSAFQTAPRHIATTSAMLLLNLMPNPPTVVQNLVVSAGNQVVIRCTTTGSRPAARLTWSYRNKIHDGEETITLDTVTKTYTVVSLLKMQVVAEDNGQSVQCKITHYLLINPSHLTASVNLNVQYPPIVSANATNTTIKDPSALLKCIAKGNPDSNYRYGKWIQRWPGFNVPVLERPGSETLVLTDLTYEYSGAYTCTASNGIKISSTNKEFVEGKAVQLLVKSFPIIINLDETIASGINKNVTVKVDFHSNVAESEVKLYQNVNGVRKSGIIYSVTKNPVDIELPVFSHMITTTGLRASITIHIKSRDEFGSYNVAISNEIGSSNKSFEVLMTERPITPSSFTIDFIQFNKARLSWKRGYNGGLAQTFVIQLGTDEKIWRDVEIYDGIKQDENPISTILTDLHDSTTYFVRLYAYNDDGNSPLSETLNFTTSPNKVTVLYKTDNTFTLIVGVVLGLMILGLVVYATYVTVLLRRRPEHATKEGIQKEKNDQTYVNTDASITLTRRDRKKDEGISESQYTELDNKLKNQESAYDAISSM